MRRRHRRAELRRGTRKTTRTLGEIVWPGREPGLECTVIDLSTTGPRVAAIAAAALADQIAARNAPPSAPKAATDRLFSTFAYTGDGAGGVEDKLAEGVLAYSDDALLYLDSVPKSLEGARLIRTANEDRKY